MKYLKFVLVVAVVVFSGSCASWFPTTTYYYMVTSGCTINGSVSFNIPNQVINYPNNSIYNYVTKAYKFKKGDLLNIMAMLQGSGVTKCRTKPITVTILKGDSPEGNIGTGGKVWRTATSMGFARTFGFAD